MWYYGEREIPSIISGAVTNTISKGLLQLPGAKVTSEVLNNDMYDKSSWLGLTILYE